MKFRGKMWSVAPLALLVLASAGCLDPIVGYPCAPGYGARAGGCVPLGGEAGPGDAGDGGDMAGGSAGDGGGGGDGPGDFPEDWTPYPDGPDEDGGDGAGGRDGTGGTAGAGTGGTAGAGTGGTAGAGTGGTAGAGTGGTAGAGTGGTAGAGTGGTAGAATGGTGGGTGVDAGDGPDGPSPGDGPDGPSPSDAPDGPPPLVCMGGLTNCSERCVNLTNDPDNCGGCGVRCGSGLCLGNVCQQQGVGHVVVIGHDYTVNRAGMNNLIGNAVFLSGDDPVTVLTYEGAATNPAVIGAINAINQVAATRGRRWTRQVALAAEVPARLAAADTFLVFAQHGATDAQLLQLGLDWGADLRTFVNSGRAVVVLETLSPNNTGTFRLLTAALLFTAISRNDVTGQTLTVVTGGDAVAVRVPRTYRAEMTSVSFVTVEAIKVVESMMGDAVVIHKVF